MSTDPSRHPVAGTDIDALVKGEDQIVPDDVDLSDATEKKKRILRAYYAFPKWEQVRIAEYAGVTAPYVKDVLERFDVEPDWAERAEMRGDDATARRIEGISRSGSDEVDEPEPSPTEDDTPDSLNDVRLVIDAIRSMATHEETVRALDHVESIIDEADR